MAYSKQAECIGCGNHFFAVFSNAGLGFNQLCEECQKELDKEKRIEYLKSLDNLSIEERLRKIEEWVYDYKLPTNPLADIIN